MYAVMCWSIEISVQYLIGKTFSIVDWMFLYLDIATMQIQLPHSKEMFLFYQIFSQEHCRENENERKTNLYRQVSKRTNIKQRLIAIATSAGSWYCEFLDMLYLLLFKLHLAAAEDIDDKITFKFLCKSLSKCALFSAENLNILYAYIYLFFFIDWVMKCHSLACCQMEAYTVGPWTNVIMMMIIMIIPGMILLQLSDR